MGGTLIELGTGVSQSSMFFAQTGVQTNIASDVFDSLGMPVDIRAVIETTSSNSSIYIDASDDMETWTQVETFSGNNTLGRVFGPRYLDFINPADYGYVNEVYSDTTYTPAQLFASDLKGYLYYKGDTNTTYQPRNFKTNASETYRYYRFRYTGTAASSFCACTISFSPLADYFESKNVPICTHEGRQLVLDSSTGTYKLESMLSFRSRKTIADPDIRYE